MKYALLVSAFLLSVPGVWADEAKETVKVCVDQQGKDGKPVLDAKTGKPKQTCKEMKKHNKHEGTKVPEKK